MYQAYATLALLLVIFEYWYGGYGVRWGFITKDKENNVCQCSKHGTLIGDTCQCITATSTHAQL